MNLISYLLDYCIRGKETFKNATSNKTTWRGKIDAITNWLYYFAWAGWNEVRVRYLISNDFERKRQSALTHWLYRLSEENKLHHNHFEHYYTEHVGLSKEFYDNKRILDIGCGPRGSLEWANNALDRIGLDPATELYEKIGINKHTMDYVESPAEDIPFGDNYFDVVICGNALDHVDDLDSVISEIKRVTATGGLLILITEVKDEPTIPEPQTFGWEIVEKFHPEFNIELQERKKKIDDGVYESAKYGPEYDSSKYDGPGVLTAKLRKQSESH